MKKIVIIILTLSVLALGYWLISPLFLNKTINETIDLQTNLEDQLDGNDMEEFKDAMKDMKIVDVEERMPEEVSTNSILSSGNVISVGHEGEGIAHVVELGNSNEHILRFENLDVLNGPDLRVLLSENTNVRQSEDLGEYIEIGKLKGNKGNQNYEIPSDIDISKYKTVVIYCKPFHVVFNVAELK